MAREFGLDVMDVLDDCRDEAERRIEADEEEKSYACR
jgi:hypothetical protein